MKAIIYLRVSSEEQGRSGLGIEAQRERCLQYVTERGFDVVGEFIEVQSGADDDRPQLALAMRQARKGRATIVVAKLDRLSRRAEFIGRLIERHARFEVSELGPEVDPFMLRIYAAIAEKERSLISERTKAALAAKRARGDVLGSRSFSRIRHLGPAAHSAAAKQRMRAARVQAAELRQRGLTLQQISDELERRGVHTARGETDWSPTQVRRLLV